MRSSTSLLEEMCGFPPNCLDAKDVRLTPSSGLPSKHPQSWLPVRATREVTDIASYDCESKCHVEGVAQRSLHFVFSDCVEVRAAFLELQHAKSALISPPVIDTSSIDRGRLPRRAIGRSSIFVYARSPSPFVFPFDLPIFDLDERNRVLTDEQAINTIQFTREIGPHQEKSDENADTTMAASAGSAGSPAAGAADHDPIPASGGASTQHRRTGGAEPAAGAPVPHSIVLKLGGASPVHKAGSTAESEAFALPRAATERAGSKPLAGETTT